MVRRSKQTRRRPHAFKYPLGIKLAEGENYRQHECYEAEYLADEEYPRYQYTIAVSAERLPKLFKGLAGILPEEVSIILEVPGPEEDSCDIWMSPFVGRAELLRIFRRHQGLLCNDGMVGYGAMNPDERVELFLDEHKMVYYYGPDMDPPDGVLGRLKVPYVKVLRHYSELSHVHYALAGEGGEDYLGVAERLMKELDLEYQESRRYT